jgi:hypothetical protein
MPKAEKWSDWKPLGDSDTNRRNGIGIKPIPEDLSKLPSDSEMEDDGSKVLIRLPKRLTLPTWKKMFPGDYTFYDVGRTKCAVPLRTQALRVCEAYIANLLK